MPEDFPSAPFKLPPSISPLTPFPLPLPLSIVFLEALATEPPEPLVFPPEPPEPLESPKPPTFFPTMSPPGLLPAPLGPLSCLELPCPQGPDHGHQDHPLATQMG